MEWENKANKQQKQTNKQQENVQEIVEKRAKIYIWYVYDKRHLCYVKLLKFFLIISYFFVHLFCIFFITAAVVNDYNLSVFDTFILPK